MFGGAAFCLDITFAAELRSSSVDSSLRVSLLFRFDAGLPNGLPEIESRALAEMPRIPCSVASTSAQIVEQLEHLSLERRCFALLLGGTEFHTTTYSD